MNNVMQIMTRPAPYALEVRAEIEAGRHPAVVIFAGPDAWHRAEHRRRTHGPGTALVWPTSETPESFAWPPVEADSIIITGLPARHRVSLEKRLRDACTRTPSDP